MTNSPPPRRSPAPALRIGCAGWQKAQKVYFAALDLIEIQQTFYKPPKAETATRWRGSAPAGFVFTLKAWQLITHEPASPTYERAGVTIRKQDYGLFGSFRPTQEVRHAWQRTLEIAQELRAPAVVFQCPPGFTPSDEHLANMRAFFRDAPREGLRFAWEPRGAGWTDELVKQLCEELDLIHCVDPFVRLPVHGAPGYFRLHGGPDYGHVYTAEELAQVAAWCRQYRVGFCVFNNKDMWDSSLRLRRLLRGGTVVLAARRQP